MKTPGPCACPQPCHAWAAATTNPDVINSPTWRQAWRDAAAAAYYPGGAGLTVVDLDNAQAIAWARASLPATRAVPTTRGEHWLYRGTMPSSNAVRTGVDIKSLMQYARWLGPGVGAITELPDMVRALAVKEPSTVRPAAITVPALAGGGDCCLTDAHIARLFTAAQTKGETAQHCTDAWTNARSRLGL